MGGGGRGCAALAFSGCCYGWCPVPVKLKCCSGLNTHQAGGRDLLWVERLAVARHSSSRPIGQGLLSQQPYERPRCCSRRRPSQPLLPCASALATEARLPEEFEHGACVAERWEMQFLSFGLNLGVPNNSQALLKRAPDCPTTSPPASTTQKRTPTPSCNSRASPRNTERRTVGTLSRCAVILLRISVLHKSAVVVAARLDNSDHSSTAYYTPTR